MPHHVWNCKPGDSHRVCLSRSIDEILSETSLRYVIHPTAAIKLVAQGNDLLYDMGHVALIGKGLSMKILIVNTYHYLRGGDCRHAFGLARMLEEAGHEVHFFAMEDPKNLPCPDEAYFVSNIDYERALKGRNPLGALKVITRSIYSAEARKKFSRALDVIKPDVAHLHSIRHHITKSILPELGRRSIPVVWTLHDYKEICPNTHLFDGRSVCEECRGGNYFNVVRKRCKKGSLPASVVTYLEAKIDDLLGYDRYVDLYVSPSAFLRDKFIEFGYAPERIVNVPNFLEIENLTPDHRSGKYLLFLGRLDKTKGLMTLLGGFARAAESIKGLELRIAGTGPMEAELRESISRRGLSNVLMLGFVGDDQLTDLVRNAKAIVLPSIWYENYPFSVLEAMALGRPVIAARIGGIPEQVDDSVTGFLFEPCDERELAQKTAKLYGLSDDEIAAMGHAARKKVEEVNSPARYLERILTIYGGLVRE
jgi:glycosyltransferase involved in cell wall biosynthesis